MLIVLRGLKKAPYAIVSYSAVKAVFSSLREVSTFRFLWVWAYSKTLFFDAYLV